MNTHPSEAGDGRVSIPRPHVPFGPANVAADNSTPGHCVLVVDPEGRAQSIHREDADPEHRHLPAEQP